MLDPQMRVTFANHAAGGIFGFNAQRVGGLHILETVPSIELERRVQDALEGESSSGPLIVTGKTGNRTYAVSAYPLTDESERAIGALVVAEDQTERLARERRVSCARFPEAKVCAGDHRTHF